MIVVNAGTFQVLLFLSNRYIHAKAGTEKNPGSVLSAHVDSER